MGLLLIVLFLVAFVFGPMLLKPMMEVRKTCSIHVWTYDISGHLFCKECRKTPEEILSE